MINEAMKGRSKVFLRLQAGKCIYCLFFLALIGIVAIAEFYTLGLARRTFVFYAIDDGSAVVEVRMLKRSPSREINIIRYVEEALLGPVSPDSLPLVPHETRLGSLLYRDGVVYADFSVDAALPPLEGGEVLNNLQTLYKGIRRNFFFVKDVRFFIDGRMVYSKAWFNTPRLAAAVNKRRLQKNGIKPDGIINFLSNEPSWEKINA